jgi:hypothetical protein
VRDVTVNNDALVHGASRRPTRMDLISVNATKEEMRQLLDMGAAEGMQQAIGQMDALLAD